MRFPFRRRHREEDLEEEIQSHLKMAEKDCIDCGESPEQAKYSARREFGNLDMVKETTREIWGWSRLERLVQDLRYALRQIRRSPGFTLAVVLTLALGIGANIAVFSVVNSALLRPLPFPSPEELVQIKWGSSPIFIPFIGPTALQEYQSQSRTLSDVAAYCSDKANLGGSEGAERISFMRASSNLLPMLGVQPCIGRGFLKEDDRPSGEPVVILSDGFWKRRFGGAPDVIGQTLRLNGKTYSIIGVLPDTFNFPDLYWMGKPDVWMPMAAGSSDFEIRIRLMSLIGRLKPSSTTASAQIELTNIWKEVKAPYQSELIQVTGWMEEMIEGARFPLLLFLGAFGFVLLIACVNVANLWSARVIAREKELAVRLGIGANRLRIFRQLLTESCVITLLGGGLGLFLAFCVKNFLQYIVSENITRVPEIHMDFRVIVFTLMVWLAVSIVVVIVAALQTSHFSLMESLKEGRSSSIGPGFHRTRRVLVIAQVGLSVTLLVGSGLLLKSLLQLYRIDPGYRTENVLGMTIDLAPVKYPTPQARSVLLEPFLEQFRHIPGVQSVAFTKDFPTGMGTSIDSLEIDGKDAVFPKLNENNLTDPIASNYPVEYQVGAGFFRTLGIPLLRGRAFTDRDSEGTPRVAVVNEEFVRRYVPDRDPIGLQIRLGEEKTSLTIVGIVGNIRQYLVQKRVSPQVYTHLAQEYYILPWPGYTLPSQSMSLVTRYRGDPAALIASARSILHNLDPDQAVHNLTTMEDELASSYSRPRAGLILIGTSSILALLLAFIGIYGVVSYSVRRQTQEIGIRMALGAQPFQIIRRILKHSLASAIIGLMLGLGGAFALTRYISSMLFGVTTTDPVVFTAISCLVLFVTLIAAYIPSRKATRIELSTALRSE
jgi:predicted permease